MATWPVVLQMNVRDYRRARTIEKAIKGLRGVESVWASPEQGLVVVHGTADVWALQWRIWRKLNKHATVLSDGSAPYDYHGTTAAPYYGPSQQACYSHQQHCYYSRSQHAYYSHPHVRLLLCFGGN